LPEEFHAEFLKEIEMPPVEYPRMSEEEEVEAIKTELVINSSVDENLAAGELKEISPAGTIAPTTEEEAKALEAQLLAEVKAGIEESN
jgi:hypothetical protein